MARAVDERALRVRERLWTLSTAAHSVPFVAHGRRSLVGDRAGLAPVSALALVHAWAIPELYAKRGANVLGRARRRDARAERTALGLLGDLVGHEARELHARTGPRARARRARRRGSWGRRARCSSGPAGAACTAGACAPTIPRCPSADRTAHLLLALREDEAGFATVANLAFSGAPGACAAGWRRAMRPALDAARAARRRAAPPRGRTAGLRNLDNGPSKRPAPRPASCLP